MDKQPNEKHDEKAEAKRRDELRTAERQLEEAQRKVAALKG